MVNKFINTLLILIFIASGSAKLLSLDFELAAFERWGYPLWFMYFTGIVEVSGGLALLFLKYRGVVSLGLSVVMCGAVMTHLINAEWPMLIVALAILAICLVNVLKHCAIIRSIVIRNGSH